MRQLLMQEELKAVIQNAECAVTGEMSMNTWREVEYRFAILRVTKRARVEIDSSKWSYKNSYFYLSDYNLSICIICLICLIITI